MRSLDDRQRNCCVRLESGQPDRVGQRRPLQFGNILGRTGLREEEKLTPILYSRGQGGYIFTPVLQAARL
jgi:hypothetical protein